MKELFDDNKRYPNQNEIANQGQPTIASATARGLLTCCGQSTHSFQGRNNLGAEQYFLRGLGVGVVNVLGDESLFSALGCVWIFWWAIACARIFLKSNTELEE